MPFSAEELIIALILIVPGFISVNLAIHLFGTSRKFSEFEKSSWSLFLSFIVDAIFLRLHEVNTIEEIRDLILFLKLENIMELFLISIVIGFLSALFLRVEIVNLFHRFIWLFSERINYVESPWEISLRNADWIIVVSDETEYFGWLAAYSTHEQMREIVIGEPEMIERDDNGNVSNAISLGGQLVIPERKIDRIVVVSYKKTVLERINAWFKKGEK